MAVDIRRVLRERPGSFLGYFLPLLILSEENEKLLDVVELFGIDRLTELIERLGGSRIIFPTWETVDALVDDAYLLQLLDDRRVDKKEIVEIFETPYDTLRARASALRRTLSTEHYFPGSRTAKRWTRNLKEITEQIRRESIDA